LRRHKAIGEQLKRKQFFFEKKNQKTFARCSPLRGAMGEFGGARNRQKFFVSFFQNKYFLPSSVRLRANSRRRAPQPLREIRIVILCILIWASYPSTVRSAAF
jgi:hypothetical protein